LRSLTAACTRHSIRVCRILAFKLWFAGGAFRSNLGVSCVLLLFNVLQVLGGVQKAVSLACDYDVNTIA